MLERMHRPEWGEAVEGVIVLVPAFEHRGLPAAVRAAVLTMTEQGKAGLKVLGLRAVEGRIQVGPAKALALVAGEQVRLADMAPVLEPDVGPVEFVVAVPHRPVRDGPREGNLDPAPLPRRTGGAEPRVPEFGAAQAMGAGAEPQATPAPQRAPVLPQAARGGVEGTEGQVRSKQQLRRREHRRVDGQLGQIMAGLRVAEGDRAERPAGAFEGTAAQREVSLPLHEVARLQVHAGLVAEHRDRHRKGAARSLVGHPGRSDRERIEHRRGGTGADGGWPEQEQA